MGGCLTVNILRDNYMAASAGVSQLCYNVSAAQLTCTLLGLQDRALKSLQGGDTWDCAVFDVANLLICLIG